MRRLHGRAVVVRVIVIWLVTGTTLLLLSALLDGFEVSSFADALGAAALIGLLNALVWPLVIRFALPITVLTLGLGVLVLNGAVVWVVAEIAPGVTLDSVATGVVVAIAITAVNTAATSLLAIDDDDFYFRNVIRREARRGGAAASDVPALYFLEIDGLAHGVLMRALRDGNAPTMARWLADGSHHLFRWECDWSSQTGRRPDRAPARHERGHPGLPLVGQGARGGEVSSSRPRDVAAIERAHLRRARAALRRRGEPREHVLRRRAAQPADDEHGAASATAPGGIGQRLLRVLRQPLQPHPDDRRSCSPTSSASSGRRPSSGGSTSARACTGASPTRSCAPGRRSSSATSRSRR